MIDNKNIYYVFQVHPHEDGLHRRLLLKVLLHDEGLHVLENHGFPEDLEKMSPEKATRAFFRLTKSQRFEVVNRHDLLQGHHADLIPDPSAPHKLPEDLRNLIAPEQSGPKVSKFDYHREGQPGAQALEIHGDIMYLDGHQLSPDEVAHVMETLKTQKAALRHPTTKSDTLEKIEPELAAALGHVRAAVKTGGMPAEALKTLTRQIFTDSMVPQMGNKKAYYDFLARPRKGVHIHLDGNDFGAINKVHGFDVGNQAIVHFGKAIREAIDESVGRKHAKSFRVGGDEFRVHVPSHEHAAAFARALRGKLEAVPAIGGTHKLSVSMGFGHEPDHAEFALIDAKNAKQAMNYPKGTAKTHVSSKVPGFEGTVPVE